MHNEHIRSMVVNDRTLQRITLEEIENLKEQGKEVSQLTEPEIVEGYDLLWDENERIFRRVEPTLLEYSFSIHCPDDANAFMLGKPSRTESGKLTTESNPRLHYPVVFYKI